MRTIAAKMAQTSSFFLERLMGAFLELQGKQIPTEFALENPSLVHLAMKARNGDPEAGQLAAAIQLTIAGTNGQIWFNHSDDIPPVV
jgi:hypothetical protein